MFQNNNSNIYPVDLTIQTITSGLFTSGVILTDILALIYTGTCFFWFIYVIRQIYWQRKQKLLLMLNRYHQVNTLSLQHQIFMRHEAIVRNSVFLTFLLFEFLFNFSFLTDASLFLTQTFKNTPLRKHVPTSYSGNCTLEVDNSSSELYQTTASDILSDINRISIGLVFR